MKHDEIKIMLLSHELLLRMVLLYDIAWLSRSKVVFTRTTLRDMNKKIILPRQYCIYATTRTLLAAYDDGLRKKIKRQ